MSLGKMIGILSIIALTVMGVSGGILYLVSWRIATQNEQQAARIVASAAAQHVSALAGLLERNLAELAHDPELAKVLLSGDPALRAEEEDRLTRLVPGALRVRLLPAGTATLDENRSPRMGFADLDLSRQALAAAPMPAVHAANTADAHLALARKLDHGEGVILASVALPLLENFMAAPQAGEGAIELRQEQLPLARQGDPARSGAPDGEVPVPKTPWKIAYWSSGQIHAEGLWFALVPLLACLAYGACAWLFQQRMTGAFRRDQQNLLALVQDLFVGKILGTYPIVIAENQHLVLQLSQLKGTRPDLPANGDEAAQPPAPAPETRPAPAPAGTVEVPAAIFRAYDIRGVVGKTLTAGMVRQIGQAIGSEAHARGEPRVMIARDGRLSSPELSQALAEGLKAAGRTVVDLGLAPTPLLYFATHVLGGKSGVMVTGSHNPANYNGLKIVIGGETLAGQDLQKLRERIDDKDFVQGEGRTERRDLIPDYIERILEDTQIGRPMKIVLDCGNGVAGTVAPALMKSMDCEVIELFSEVDGSFPNHHPDPGKPENLQFLIEAVREQQADLGVAFDGDGDRLGVVDSGGKIIWPDRLMMLFAADVLSREPGADIIYDVKCSRHLASQIVRNGGRPMMWRSGHSPIKARLKETGAMLAGEMSGHVFFKERWYGFDDGIYACARLVEILSGDPRSTAEVFAELPDSCNTPELSVGLREGENFLVIDQLKAITEFPDARITEIDGLRVDFADGWGLVRASNTMPSLTFRFEADDEAAMSRIQAQFRSLLLRVKPQLTLPF